MPRCAKCGKKSIYHRAKTNDYRCKSCSYVSSKTKEQVDREDYQRQLDYLNSPEGIAEKEKKEAEQRKQKEKEEAEQTKLSLILVASLVLSVPFTRFCYIKTIEYLRDSLIAFLGILFFYPLGFILSLLFILIIIRIVSIFEK